MFVCIMQVLWLAGNHMISYVNRFQVGWFIFLFLFAFIEFIFCIAKLFFNYQCLSCFSHQLYLLNLDQWNIVMSVWGWISSFTLACYQFAYTIFLPSVLHNLILPKVALGTIHRTVKAELNTSWVCANWQKTVLRTTITTYQYQVHKMMETVCQ